MSPILVPTLHELWLELSRLDGQRVALSAANDADPKDAELANKYEAAVDGCWQLLDQIAGLPAASISDLRMKARAFDWSARLLDNEPYHNPSAGEERILHQLVAGLLDERFA